MGNPVRNRLGYSLLELIIVIAILAILMGLLLPALQRVRESAALMLNKNNLRQTIMATHQVAGDNEGRVDNLTRSSMKGVPEALADMSLFYRLTPYVHAPRVVPTTWSNQTAQEWYTPNVKVYRNPSDPSWDYDPALANVQGKCSYALNMYAMDGSFNLASSIPDGTSQTIAFVDKYTVRGSPTSTLSQTKNLYTCIFDPYQGEIYGNRRATFADHGWEDVLPVTDPATVTTRPSTPGKTFQVRPRPEDVDPSIPQTPHRAGLTVALFDGSVRTISPAVHESVFWAMVTPAGGEVISDW